MPKNNDLTLKILLLIFMNDIGDSIAQLFLKKGFLAGGVSAVNFSNAGDFISRNAQCPWVWLGLFIYVMNFFIWIIVLYRVDLSVAMPIGSTSYILIPFLSVFFLHEDVSALRWIGTFLVAAGIYFVMQSKHVQSNGKAGKGT